MDETTIVCRNGPVGCPFASLVRANTTEKKPEKIDVWKERIIREYKETKERYERLHAYNVRCKASRDESLYDMRFAETKSREDLLARQEKVMREYLDILEMRMALADIPF